jgi:hypothetical protein
MNEPTRPRTRLRAGTRAWMALPVVVVLGAASSAGCGSDSSDSGPKFNIAQSANSADFMSPFDATPDPDGKNVYFTALTKDGDPGVFKSSATPGGAVTKLFSGAPLATPVSITITEDGKTLLIADAAADNAADDDQGAVFSMSVDGGAPSALGGTEGTQPHGIEVAGDQAYFTGRKDGKPGVYKIPVGGGGVSPVAAGDPFTEPSGVAVTAKGVVFVAESGSSGNSSVIKIDGGVATVFATGLAVGFPAGIALTKDDGTLLVSGFDTASGTDVVFNISTSNGKDQKLFSDGIKQYSESAGLHRARHADVFAWADAQANNTGTVYVLTK